MTFMKMIFYIWEETNICTHTDDTVLFSLNFTSFCCLQTLNMIYPDCLDAVSKKVTPDES